MNMRQKNIITEYGQIDEGMEMVGPVSSMYVDIAPTTSASTTYSLRVIVTTATNTVILAVAIIAGSGTYC